MNSLWETPKNTEFLELIINEIWSGKIVLAFLPNHTPDDFLSQLKIKFGENKSIIYEKINLAYCDETDKKPIESLLFSHFELEEQTDTFIKKSTASIFNYVDFNPQKIFVFQNLPSTLIDHFREFIFTLAHHLISKSVHERHKVLVLLNPENFKLSDFTSESGIQRILYEGYSDKLDHTLSLRYYHKYEDEPFTPLYERMITSLSVYDPGLTESLIDCDNLIEDYREQLNEYAKSKKWDKISYKQIKRLTEDEIWEMWSKGILDKVNDEYEYHSAFLGIHNKESELEKRIWQSGIEILMPLIEEIRDRILKSKKLEFPDTIYNYKTEKFITNKMDLEIGEICYNVNKKNIRIRWLNSSETNNVYDFINLCKTIRNDLSHLRIPSTQNIKKFFQGYDRIYMLLQTD